MEDDLIEIKEWLRIDGEDEDNTLSSLLASSRAIIKQGTGLIKEDIKPDDKDITELYKLAQKILITDLYENRTGSESNPGLISICMQLEVYKLKLIQEAELAESSGNV
jgi:uncharacterized phage protein (predicted DNA packaging)